MKQLALSSTPRSVEEVLVICVRFPSAAGQSLPHYNPQLESLASPGQPYAPASSAIAEQLAAKTHRRDYGALGVLAAAQASAGRFAEAEATAEVAVALAELADDRPYQDLLKAHLARYRAGQIVELKSFFPTKRGIGDNR